MNISVHSNNGVTYCALVDAGSPASVVYRLIEEVEHEFEAQVAQSYAFTNGDIESVLKDFVVYEFIGLDRFILRKIKSFNTSASSNRLAALQVKLNTLHGAVQENLNELVLRGENLESVSANAYRLKERSAQFSSKFKQ